MRPLHCLVPACWHGPSWAQARTITDSAGRKVVLPDRINRVFVAGPPASVLVYTLAPDAMVGWIRLPTAAEKEFLTAPARDLPETGRLTGRGDTMSLELLVAAKPDLVVDFGSVADTYVVACQSRTGADRHSLCADRRYALPPRRHRCASPAASWAGQARGAELADYADKTFANVDAVLARVPAGKRHVSTWRAAPKAWRRAGAAPSTPRSSSAWAASTSPRGPGRTRQHRHNASLEQIIAWQPDVIVTLDRAFFIRA